MWADATLEALQRKGLRNGGARRAVIELLAEQDCCLTAQEIFDRLRASGRQVGIARYEPAHSDGEHHHHLVCDACGKVEAFEDRGLEQAIHRLETRSGYAV